MAGSLLPQPKQVFTDDTGKPLSGGQIYTYAAGSLTPKATYQDAALTIANTNPVIANARGEVVLYGSGAYRIILKDKQGSTIWDRDNIESSASAIAGAVGTLGAALAAGGGAALVGFRLTDAGLARTVQAKLREFPSVADAVTVGDGVADDTVAIKAAIDGMPQRGRLTFPKAAAYKVTDTISVVDKAGAILDFGNQQINAASFATPKQAVYFKGMSEATIDNIFVIGSRTNTNTGVLFDADAGSITIHTKVGKVHVSNCATGIQVGTATYQVSDSTMDDLYGSDCDTGVVFTGENTLAMNYGRVAAYNNSNIGVLFEEGGGLISSLQVAASHNDLFFGHASGLNHGKLARWDILSGYSEEGVTGEVFINSVACADTNPFNEQIAISGFRVTPFTSTNKAEFIQWRLNGDLILRDMTVGHGQQAPVILVEHNAAYRAPRVEFSGVIDCSPKSAPQLPMGYRLTDPSQSVEINARVNNGLTQWHNNGGPNEGTIKRGIYMRKRKLFESALLNIGNLAGAWSLAELSSGSCRNLMPGGSSLELSAMPERRDFWLDDGLIGFYRNSTTSKTASTTSTVFSAGEYTFGCMLRPAIAGVDESANTSLGGAGGMRLGLGDTGGAFARLQVGAYNIQAAPSSPLDPHLVIGRYVPGVSIAVDAINLRTGEIVSASQASAPTLVALTWSNGVSIRNDLCVRGFPFAYRRALTNAEVSQLLQAAMQLTDSWR